MMIITQLHLDSGVDVVMHQEEMKNAPVIMGWDAALVLYVLSSWCGGFQEN